MRAGTRTTTSARSPTQRGSSRRSTRTARSGRRRCGTCARRSTSRRRGGSITAALPLAPTEPSFLDMRNAILGAAGPRTTRTTIWQVFAARGMGYFASTDGSTDIEPIADDSPPRPNRRPRRSGGTVRDEQGQPLARVRTSGSPGQDTQARTGGELGPTLADDTACRWHVRDRPLRTTSIRWSSRAARAIAKCAGKTSQCPDQRRTSRSCATGRPPSTQPRSSASPAPTTRTSTADRAA